MKRLRAWGINGALVLLSLVAAWYLARGADWAAGKLSPPLPPAKDDGLIFQPNVASEFEMHDYTTVERINSLGFRDNEVPLKSEHAIRILAVGDSFTYGWGVNLEETWCKALERNLQAQGIDAEVLNLGRPGGGPLEYVDIVERAVPLLQPDFVLVGILAADDLQQMYGNGSFDRLQRLTFPNLSRLLGRTADKPQESRGFFPIRPASDTRSEYVAMGEYLLKQMPPEQRARFDALPEEVRAEYHAGRLNPWLLQHSTSSPDYFLFTLSQHELGWRTRTLAQCLKRIRTLSSLSGAPVLALNIPEGFLVNKEAWENVQRIGFKAVPELLENTLLDDAAARAAERAGVTYFSGTSGFRARQGERGLYLALDRHMTPAGNKLLADLFTPAVADWIRERQT